jgi:hypothetical protein
MELLMIRGRGLGVAGWERECVPHRRIRHRLDYRLIFASGFSPHTLSGSAGTPRSFELISKYKQNSFPDALCWLTPKQSSLLVCDYERERYLFPSCMLITLSIEITYLSISETHRVTNPRLIGRGRCLCRLDVNRSPS